VTEVSNLNTKQIKSEQDLIVSEPDVLSILSNIKLENIDRIQWLRKRALNGNNFERVWIQAVPEAAEFEEDSSDSDEEGKWARQPNVSP